MGIITVAELKPEMVLADDLRALNGRFLLAKGTRLTDKHLRIIKVWGVIEADIEGASQEEIEANPAVHINPAILKAAQSLTLSRFIHTDPEHPAVRELLRLCTLREVERLSSSKGRRKAAVQDSSKAEAKRREDLPKTATPPVSPSELFRSEITLSTLPIILVQINEAIRKPNSSAKDIANVISRDTTLSVKLLKIVNSAFYGYPSRIDSLSRAVLIVGIKQLSALAMGIKIISIFKSIPSDLIDMRSFLEHSIGCGIIARILASYKNIQNIERLFVGGLLHDIGRLILYNNAPDGAANVLLEARQTSHLLRNVERESMACDHARIGGHLLKKWKLPLSLENIVTYHHAPHKSKDPLEPAIVHLADIMTNALEIGSSGECLVPPLNPAAWEHVGLSPNILPLVVKQMDAQYEETLRFLISDD